MHPMPAYRRFSKTGATRSSHSYLGTAMWRARWPYKPWPGRRSSRGH